MIKPTLCCIVAYAALTSLASLRSEEPPKGVPEKACAWPSPWPESAVEVGPEGFTMDAPEDADDGEPCGPKPDWKLLCAEGDQRPIRIRLIMFKFAGFVSERQTPDPLDFQTSDPETLRRIAIGLRYSTRPAPNCGCGAMGDLPIGQLQICTELKVYVIAIFNHGFGLESRFVSTENEFFSWGLAQQIDELHFQQLKRHLSADQLRGLSGERRIDFQRKEFGESPKAE